MAAGLGEHRFRREGWFGVSIWAGMDALGDCFHVLPRSAWSGMRSLPGDRSAGERQFALFEHRGGRAVERLGVRWSYKNCFGSLLRSTGRRQMLAGDAEWAWLRSRQFFVKFVRQKKTKIHFDSGGGFPLNKQWINQLPRGGVQSDQNIYEKNCGDYRRGCPRGGVCSNRKCPRGWV